MHRRRKKESDLQRDPFVLVEARPEDVFHHATQLALGGEELWATKLMHLFDNAQNGFRDEQSVNHESVVSDTVLLD
jgi:hypothetical protein